ncbi:hypothetical protein B0H16DRAFT_1749905 [Mycena metata]|uniref:Uncharacterized protein n=1 Tax=Mycena metata TaxID=1033252 RepID=A0AAD7DRC2_9AGAR|nr:hypothetical protein B0H16DRAFT_1749905 [Mycena metata]
MSTHSTSHRAFTVNVRPPHASPPPPIPCTLPLCTSAQPTRRNRLLHPQTACPHGRQARSTRALDLVKVQPADCSAPLPLFLHPPPFTHCSLTKSTTSSSSGPATTFRSRHRWCISPVPVSSVSTAIAASHLVFARPPSPRRHCTPNLSLLVTAVAALFESHPTRARRDTNLRAGAYAHGLQTKHATDTGSRMPLHPTSDYTMCSLLA